MPTEISYLSAFLVGLLGGAHCVGMCGGIISALTLASSPSSTNWRFLLTYNVGRISSYTLAGLIVAGLGAQLATMYEVQVALKIIAGLFMIAMGLYIAGWWFGLSKVEQLGGLLWKHIQPLGNRFIPVRTAFQAGILGLLWGWLPCGLVYSVLIWSISANSAIEGALLLLSFGIGTLPNLLAMGMFAIGLKKFMQKQVVRVSAGLLITGFGLYQLTLAL